MNIKNLVIGGSVLTLALAVGAHPLNAQAWSGRYSYNSGRTSRARYARAYNGAYNYNQNQSNVAWVPTVESWQYENGRGGYGNAGNGYAANGQYYGWVGSPNASTLVNWGVRGGTCNIRYSAVDDPVYFYRTSAGCDEVSHVVMGLMPGQTYKFEIAQDNWDRWSAPAVAKAY